MKTSKGFSRLFAVLGVLMAAAVIAAALFAREANPRLLFGSADASRCADAMLARLSSGDFAGASAYLYGSPKLDSGKERTNAVTQQIWDAFTGSLSYELVGEGYATVSGVSQRVRVRGMDISSVTANLKQRAQALLEQRVENAQTMAEVYDADYNYREDFVAGVLRDAADQAIRQDGQSYEKELVLNLVYEKGQWWVVPDSALLNAVSGGILG